jgi:hypothetical protein
VYVWHAGYWGPHIGFYGGVNYGFGYFGVGYVGGFWAGSVFRYNAAVTAVNTTVIRNVYVDRTVIHNTVVSRVSYNGPNGITAHPTPQEQMAMREQHTPPLATQFQHQEAARADRAQYASVNHGQPATTTMDRINGRRFRIANGIATGHLNASQAAHLERRETNVNTEIRNDRQSNGGTLTPQERQQVNRQQNQMSKQIYNEKHEAHPAQGEKRNEHDHPPQGEKH